MIDFCMPSLGADMESGFLREWKVKPGDTVKRGDIIALVETQKGIIDIEIFEDGTIVDIVIKEDEKVPVGSVMAHLLPIGEPIPVVEPEKKKAIPIPEHHIKVTPLARRIAETNGIDLTTLRGSGPDGAITQHDVEQAIAAHVAPAKEEKPSTAVDSIRMAVAAAMSRSNREIPHYYLETNIDMKPALTWLEKTNKHRSVEDRLLPAVLFIKAVAMALQETPELNGYWDNGFQKKEDIHIGFVVSLRTGGIIVPAIHHAAKKSIDELMKNLTDLIVRSRALRLRSSELSDSTITLTSLGDGGIEKVYGVIYPPQVALVGFGGIHEHPWTENGMLDVRPVITVSLAADHRATDGNIGSRFLSAVKRYLTQPEKL